MTTSIRGVALAALLALASCGSDEPTPEVFTWGADGAGPPPPEVFTWNDCGLEFTPPPAEWGRQRLQTSLDGVSFRMSRLPPGVIDIGTYRSLHRTHTVRSASGSERSFDPPPPDFTLADVVDRVRFDPESLPPTAGAVVQPDVDRTVDGLPALAVDYTWTDRGHVLHCREVYVVSGACLYVARVSGDAADLALFEHVVATMRFSADFAATQ